MYIVLSFQAVGGNIGKLQQADKTLLEKATRTGSISYDEEEQILEQTEQQRQDSIQDTDVDPLANREVVILGGVK